MAVRRAPWVKAKCLFFKSIYAYIRTYIHTYKYTYKTTDARNNGGATRAIGEGDVFSVCYEPFAQSKVLRFLRV